MLTHNRLGIKTRTTLLLLASLAITTSSLADITFSSEITFAGMPQNMPSQKSKTFIKGFMTKNVTDMMTMIIDGKKKTMTSINPTAKTYTVTSMDTETAAMEMSIKGSVKRTNETKMILGMSARKYIIDVTMIMGKDTKNPMKMAMEQWATESISIPKEALALGGDFLAGMGISANNPSMAAFQKEMLKVKGLALLTLMTMDSPMAPKSGQKISITMKVTAIDQKKIPTSEFQIPKGYKKIETPTPARR